MKSISLDRLKTMDLQQLKVRSCGGNIYYTDDKIYKLFKTDDRFVIMNKRCKIEILHRLRDYAYAFLPTQRIVDGPLWSRTLKGYVMDRRENGVILSELSTNPDYFDDYLFALLDASLHLKITHERPEKIILGDANFDNIMVYPDRCGKYTDTMFVDFDSVQICGLEAEAVSVLLKEYFYYKGFPIIYGRFYKSMDKISHLLHFFYSIFSEDIFKVSSYKYDELSEILNTLYRLRPTFYLLRTCRGVPDVPYLHEVIDVKDVKMLSKCLNNSVKLD